ncbi:MAG: 50S ribosomal protein L11 methyltransferase [Candidatus Riflebacteria bacterium]|nr:50S ribosomal protein L11 methyltransferase [Candidatus Riflebacteria bacterium]
MLKRFNLTVPSELEEPLLGLADKLGLSAFSNPQICDAVGKGETDFVMTGETIVSFIASTVEQDTAAIEVEIIEWLNDFEQLPACLSSEEYADNQDWMLGFREHFKPICVGNSIIIRPPWAEPLPGENEATTILIDPGMAFGTGTHETTRLCLELLEPLDLVGSYFLDIGAGSGILAFYMMKRAASGGIAIEIEGAAVENMRKNAALNGISDRLHMLCADLASFVPALPAEGLIANITSPVIIEYLPLMSQWVRQGSWGVFSGVNSTNAAAVKKAFVDNGWHLIKEITDGDWHGFYLDRL